MSQRRKLATVDMNPTRKKPHSSSSSSSSSTTSHSTIRSKSDLNPSSAVSSSSSSIKKPNFLKWVPNHKTPSSSSHSLKPSSNPPSRVINSALLQVKSLTLSADAVSSINRSSLLNKKNTHYQIQQHNSVEEIKNESREMERKEEIKEKKMITKSKSQRGEGDHEEKRKSLSLLVNGGDGGGRRKSLCDSKIELSDFFSKVGARIMAVDMPPFMQIHAVSCARECYDSLEPKFTSKNLALTLKKEFDGVYGPAWHCIVGTSFGSFVTHSVGGFLYFFMDHKLYILLFKTTVQKAD